MHVSNRQFRNIVSNAIDGLPKEYIDNMKNVAVVVEDEPSDEQRHRLQLVNGVTLYGLYEGIPLTKRGANYSLVLPDKITIFKKPIEQNCENIEQLKEQVMNTVWHEIAHHYGLDHHRIKKIEDKR